jgi:F-type H+-transporting ATPase subunit b
MSSTLSTFLFELTNFLLLAGLLGWLLFKPVRTALQERQAAEKQQVDALAARTAEADRLRTDLAQRHSAFEQEMASLRAEHMAAVDLEATAIRAGARDAATRERESMTRMLGHLEHAQAERLAAVVAATTRDAVERLLTSLGAPGLEAALLDSACRQVRALDGGSLGAALIESAQPLSADAETAVRTALDHRATDAEFRVVPKLGAGIRMTTAGGLVDASAAGIASQAERLLIEALTNESPEVAIP